MDISVEYIDQAGVIYNQSHRLTRIAFAKHMAIAGQGYAPKPKNLIRAIAMIFHYSYYVQKRAFNNNRFSLPPTQLSDPTEKSHFSNLAGKAIADFLSKRIGNSIYTVNYEAAMRMRGMPIRGGRPDLLAFAQNSMFAIEAKGFSGPPGDMAQHKLQSQTGGIPVNYSIACVSYGLYNNVKCNYHDPFNGDIPFDNTLLRNLTRDYYKGLAEFLKGPYFEFREIEYQGENFYEVQLSFRFFEKLFVDEGPFPRHWHYEFFDFYRPSLLLPKEIEEYSKNGITSDFKPFNFVMSENNYIYIDNDRVGLKIRG